jgi:hypothetical protein
MVVDFSGIDFLVEDRFSEYPFVDYTEESMKVTFADYTTEVIR